MLAFDTVFEIHPDGAGIDDSPHRLSDFLRRHPVARFHIGGDRDGDPARDSRNGREHVVASDALAVGIPEAKSNAGTGRGERREAGFDKDPRAARVPCVGQHEHRSLHMELTEERCLGVHGRALATSYLARR